MNLRNFYIAALALLPALPLAAQEQGSELAREFETRKVSKAWEIGLGGTMFNWNRVTLSRFKQHTDGHYNFNLRIEHLMPGANLYVARELNKWFYLDLQGNVSFAKSTSTDKGGQLFLGGLGLQWRLSPLFKSHFVEPYLRVGGNYLYKNFSSPASGGFLGDLTNQAYWDSHDIWNPNGHKNDNEGYVALSGGVGMNAWLNNHWGIGFEGNYYMPIDRNNQAFAQGTVRVMYRCGGAKKYSTEQIFVDRVVEKPVEKIVEKIVEKQVLQAADPSICELLDQVDFDFDKYTITAESSLILDELATILKTKRGKNFLLTGFTDAHGTDAYNIVLSRNRAKAVREALIARGVDANMLKSRGVGKRTAAMPKRETDHARRGDRKVTIEIVRNLEYWNKLDQY